VAGKTYTVNHILNTVFNLGYSTVVFDVGITVTVLLSASNTEAAFFLCLSAGFSSRRISQSYKSFFLKSVKKN